MEFSNVIKKSMLGVAFAGLAATSFGTQAAVINGLFDPGPNQIEDTDVERVVDSTGAVKTSGNFVVGDTIQTILRFNTVNATTISDVYGSPYQLNAYAELKVDTITDLNLDGDNNINTGLVNIVFAPTGNLNDVNAFADLYERTSAAQSAFDQTVAPATGISNVTSETLIASLGLGQADDFWSVNTLLDISAAASLQAGDAQVSNGVFGLSVLSNPGALPIRPDMMLGADGNLHDVVGNASAYQLGPFINGGWLVSSNTSANFNVPEPTPIALLGLGLAIIGFTMRKRVS